MQTPHQSVIHVFSQWTGSCVMWCYGGKWKYSYLMALYCSDYAELCTSTTGKKSMSWASFGTIKLKML